MEHNNSTYTNHLCRCQECRAAANEYQKAYQKRKRTETPGWGTGPKRRRLLSMLKLERGCMDCGYNDHAEALDFDHRPGEIKCFTISGALTHAWPTVLAEITKCDVVCANCHRMRTARRRACD